MIDTFLGTIHAAMEPLAMRFNLRVQDDGEGPKSATVLYLNDSVGLRITLDWTEFRPFVEIYRLEDGQLPEDAAVAIAYDRPINAFDADGLILLRGKGASTPVGKMFNDRSPDGVFPLLREYATSLEQHAADVLSGDFSVLPTIDAIVRQSFKKM